MTHKLVVIGGGIGGAAAALRAAQYQIPTLWILGDRKTAKKSRARWVKNIDNMIGVHPGIVLEKIKKEFLNEPHVLEKLNALHLDIGTEDIIQNVKDRLKDYGDLVTQIKSEVTNVKKSGSDFVVSMPDQTTTTPYLVVSTGLMDTQPTIYKLIKDKPSPKTAWIYPFANAETVLYCSRCEGHLTRHHKTAVIGFSDVAAQIAIMLFERYQQVSHILLNGETSQISPETQKQLSALGITIEPGKIVDLQHKTENKGALNAIVLENTDPENQNKIINVDFAFISMGLHHVYHDFLKDLNIKLAQGSQPDHKKRVLIDAKGETHEPNLFCIGDMAVREDEAVMMQIYTAQEYAVRAIDTIDRRIRIEKRKQLIPTE